MVGVVAKVLLLDLHVRDLVGEVLCLDRDGRQKVCECTTRRDRQLLLHVPRRVTAEQSCIAFAQDAGKALAIDAAPVQPAGQGLLRVRELLADRKSVVEGKSVSGRVDL